MVPVDDQAYIESQLFSNPGYLAQLAALGVLVPPELLPPSLRHLATAPASAGLSTGAAGSAGSGLSQPISAALLSPALAQPLPVAAADIVSGGGAGAGARGAPGVAPGTYAYAGAGGVGLGAADEQRALGYTRSAGALGAAPGPLPIGGTAASVSAIGGAGQAQGQAAPSQHAVFVESKTTGDFHRVSGGWVDPTASSAMQPAGGGAGALPRTLGLDAAQPSVHAATADAVQQALAFALLLCAGAWSGLCFLQVYIGRAHASDAAFAAAYTVLAAAAYVANFILGSLTLVLSGWFMILGQFSPSRRFRLTDWAWQVQLNLIVTLAACVGFYCTLASARADNTLVYLQTADPTWYAVPVTLAAYQGRLDDWYRANAVRFIATAVAWVLVAVKHAFGHAVNPDLPLHAQLRGVRAVPLPESVALHPTAAHVHVADNVKAYAHIFPSVVADPDPPAGADSAFAAAHADRAARVREGNAPDLDLSVRAVYAFV